MKVILTIRNSGSGRVNVTTDFKSESNNTPRIHNLGMEIKSVMDEMCGDGSKIKVINTKENNEKETAS